MRSSLLNEEDQKIVAKSIRDRIAYVKKRRQENKEKQEREKQEKERLDKEILEKEKDGEGTYQICFGVKWSNVSRNTVVIA